MTAPCSRRSEPKTTTVILIGNYWYDEARAERTPRGYFYFHLGMLSGMVMRLLDTRDHQK